MQNRLQRFVDTAKKHVPRPLQPAARWLNRRFQSIFVRTIPTLRYRDKMQRELAFFSQGKDVHELPPIAHYWSNKHLVPLLRPLGFTNALECFRAYLAQLCVRQSQCAFLSIGSGSCDAEINMAEWLKETGHHNFQFHCLDINPTLLDQGEQTAAAHAMSKHFSFSTFDVNTWQPQQKYHAVVALQSLHHIVELEILFRKIRDCLDNDGYFFADDMIGRNGHQRWPEALSLVHKLWDELPGRYKYNHQLKRFEPKYENWDCSVEGFEGIRAQDILPLLIQYFHFEVFAAFGNVIDVFIDRGFGHNFDPDSEWDRAFIDRIQELDWKSIENANIKPTHMIAVMRKHAVANVAILKHLSPEFCVRIR
ncbi:MAG: class I SAM-dependent methyltransferase [Acidobacteria bacterium]|nr:class I SAM-dependent methyltransferase [Acidobacteriota bacterium]